MGKAISSLIKRPAKNWNIENRAHNYLDKQAKPIMSPRHPTTTEIIDNFSKEHPEILEEQARKDEKLSKMLKGMVVNPERMGNFASATSKSRSLPIDRLKLDDEEFGYLEPTVIRPGRCTIRQALEFIGGHYSDPVNLTADKIATQYKLEKRRVELVLQYFHVFHVQMPGHSSAAEGSAAGLIEQAKALKPGFFKGEARPSTAGEDLSSTKSSEANSDSAASETLKHK